MTNDFPWHPLDTSQRAWIIITKISHKKELCSKLHFELVLQFMDGAEVDSIVGFVTIEAWKYSLHCYNIEKLVDQMSVIRK